MHDCQRGNRHHEGRAGPLSNVTLAEERRQHDEYQFDAAAVIVPLISSTGHGHASIKRIHYQEGKFALGTILCAVIPKDEALLNPRYLFVYLQQFKDSVLVPLMKGAANVSLPLNKLASLEIEVPTLALQQEVIDLAHMLTGHNNDLEALLDAQEGDTMKLRQALLREAMQGQLLPQDLTDEPAALLLKKLQAAKAASGKGRKSKAGALLDEPIQGPFEIPENWVWCTLGDLAFSSEGGSSFKCEDKTAVGDEWGILKMSAISSGRFLEQENKFYSKNAPKDISAKIKAGDFIITRASGSAELVAKSVFVQEVVGNVLLNDKTIRYDFGGMSDVVFLNYCNNSSYARAYFRSVNSATSTTMKNVTRGQIDGLPIPLPPLAEQHRIVAKLEQFHQHCEALEQRIRESRRLAEQLLQTALREALAPPAGNELAFASEAPEPAASRRRGLPAQRLIPQNSLGPLFSQLEQ